MKMQRLTFSALLIVLALGGGIARAELVEEIVAWVNGEIITKSELDEEQKIAVEQAYRRFVGAELDAYLQNLEGELLLTMIDRKILVDEARRLYDLDVMGNAFLESFREQQGIESDAEFNTMLEQEGMTLEEVKRKLVEMFAPDEVIRFHVTSRVGVSDSEVERFYEDNRERFAREAEVTLREIVLLAETSAAKDRRRPEAAAVHERVTSGESFADVAAEVSEAGTKASGGLLGTMKRADLARHLAEPAFTLPVGSVSDVLETAYGFHILRIEERDDSTVAPLDKVRANIRGLLQQMKTAEELNAYLTEIRGQSEWCVKPKYKERLPVPASTTCSDL